MKKLSLALEDLKVDSFSTLDEPAARGKTVKGYVSMMSCSCQACATYTDCETGDTNCGTTCSKDVPTQVWEVTCLPTCAGYTCDYETCGDCYSEVC